MIYPQWTVIDLDPLTWRNLGRFFDPGQYLRTAQPDEHGLFVLHDDGRALRVVDTQAGVVPGLVPAHFDNPHTLAHDLFEEGRWDRVHVINKRHLAGVARLAQTEANRALTLDAYYHHLYELLWRRPGGYVSVPPHPGDWNGWTYSQFQQFVNRLPDPAALALGVLDHDQLSIGLILEVRGGLIRRVTTFEALALDAPPPVSAEGLEQLWAAVAARLAPPAAVALCDQATFEGWITAPHKTAFVLEAAQHQRLFYRLRLSS